MTISPKQVAMLHALFNKASIWGQLRQLDWLLVQGVDVPSLEEMTPAQLDKVLPELRRLGES